AGRGTLMGWRELFEMYANDSCHFMAAVPRFSERRSSLSAPRKTDA
ncbi:uncharacterized, partial [Tachysurus ichikawai]